MLETIPRQWCCCGSHFIVSGVNVICIIIYMYLNDFGCAKVA